MVIVSDIRMPGMDGIVLLSQIKAQQPNLPVIITTAHSDLDSAVSAYEEGAFEYLPKPFDIDEMVATVQRAQSQRIQIAAASAETRLERTTDIIGNAPAMQEVAARGGCDFGCAPACFASPVPACRRNNYVIMS